MNPVVSIVVTIGGDTEYLSGCFRSLQKQTFTDFEVLMITTSASQQDLSLCQKIEKEDPRFVLHRRNSGRINPARNYGIEHATGEWLIFLEPGDVLAARCLQTVLDCAKEYQADAVSWNGYLMKDDDVKLTDHRESKPVVFRSITDKELLITNLYVPETCEIPYGVFMRSCKGKMFRMSCLIDHHLRFVVNMRVNNNLLFLSKFLLSCKTVVVATDYLQRSLFREEKAMIHYKPDIMNLQMEMFDETRKLLLPRNIPFKKIEYQYWNNQEKDFILNWIQGGIPPWQGLNYTRIFIRFPVIRSSLCNGRGKSRSEKLRSWLLGSNLTWFAALNDTLSVLWKAKNMKDDDLSLEPTYTLENVSLQQLIHETDTIRSDQKKDQSMNHETTALDYSYPYEELYMVKNGNMPKQSPELPAGFYWAKHPVQLKMQWINNLKQLGFTESFEQAQEQWEKMENLDGEFFHSHLYAAVSETGTLASIVGIWPCSEIPGTFRLHWMMTNSAFQRHGLGRKVIQKALYEFSREFPEQPIYLSTQAQSWPAIRLYESEGFTSYEEETRSASARENKDRWSRTRVRVLEKEHVSI